MASLPVDPPEQDNLDSTRWQRFWSIVTYTPKRCRWNPENPMPFSMALNALFAFAACFTVAGLYYNHPILNILANDFGVSYEQASIIPTLTQTGYAGGLLFICPLGDLVRRRPLVLGLVWFTGTVWIGLCVTRSFGAFCALSLITGFTTVTPQLMLPLVGTLAPEHRRATYLSIVVSGLLLGLLVARLLSGVVTNFVTWRIIYWIAFGLQYLILILLWFFMPDYPSSNPDGLNYFKMLWSIIVYIRREPLIAYACAIGMCASATFTSFWTTLTFLLASPPYNYSSLDIGCFALIGIGAMTFGPFVSRLFTDRFHPQLSVLTGSVCCLASHAVGAYTGSFTIAGPIIQGFGMDLSIQMTQIANRSMIYGIDVKAQNRINTAYMFCVFIGQVMGTAVGNRLYAMGGWRASGTANVAFMALAILICLMKGPHEKGWYGWSGGYSMKRKPPPKADDEEQTSAAAAVPPVEKRENETGEGAEPSGNEKAADRSPTLHAEEPQRDHDLNDKKELEGI